MEESPKTSTPDRWWITASCIAIASIILVSLLWKYPTSKLVWAVAGGVIIFVAVVYFNPRYRYWRRANWCFTTASILAYIPTFVGKASLEAIGAFEVASDASPVVVLGFLGGGLYLSWLDSRQHLQSLAQAPITAANTNLSVVNSPNAVMGLTAGGNIIINQGVSEETLLETIDVHRIALQAHQGIRSETLEVNDELVWRLLDDIKAARRRLEREDASKRIADLRRSFDLSGKSWSKLLRTEALLILAEEERQKLSQLRAQGHQIDLCDLQVLLTELRNAGN